MKSILTKIRNIVFVVTSFIFLIFTVSMFSYQFTGAETAGPKINVGYFYGNEIVLNSASKGSYVLKYGLPSNINSKSTFIGYIKDLRGGLEGDKHGDIIGASYIIQTMRGPDSNGNWDHEIPDAADIEDWEKRINNPEITIAPLENFRYSINTRRDRDGEPASLHDVSRYHTGVSTESSFVFYKNGVVQYAIKRSCGNPLGYLSGLPVVLQNWSLTPHLSLSSANYIEAGSSFNITSYINNTGEVTSGDVTYNLEKKVGSGAYTTYAPHSGVRPFPLGATYVTNNLGFSDTNYNAGTQICFRLSVNPQSNKNPGLISSAPACVTIVKKPKVQIWGGDLLAGRQVKSSTSDIGGYRFGSWAEYGIVAGGLITGTASGSAYAGSGLSPGNMKCDSSKLSFSIVGESSNCASNTEIGNYKNGQNIPDVAASFPGGTLINSIVIPSDMNSGTYTAGDITLNASELAKGKSIIIKSTGTVTIAGNQTYNNGPYSNIFELPQLVIIAKDIVIQDDVTQVDAWLIAKVENSDKSKDQKKTGSIKTCGVEAKIVNACNKQLIVNGPVVTDKLYLYRTAGSEAGNIGEPAEIFNLRADSYLWSFARSSGSGRIQTVYTTELPPRF